MDSILIQTQKPLITAHSGCEGTLIDTMDSIEKALAANADAAEIDVRIDPLGELRISHDPLSLEDYFKKNPLADVFNRVSSTRLLLNFDIKEAHALEKTLEKAEACGFPGERLIFTGCTDPGKLAENSELTARARFFLNLEEILKYIYNNRKEELPRELFAVLMENPLILVVDENSTIPEVYLSQALMIQQKLFAVSKMILEKIFEDILSIYHEFQFEAVNLPKFLLKSHIMEVLQAGNIPLSVWTVDEEDNVQRCLELGVYNITTRMVQMTKKLRDEYPSRQQ